MSREVRWERMFPDELEEAFDEKPVLYLTYGLCEPHGPHNAVGLDALKAHAIAVEVARTFGGIVAPTDYWHIHELGGYAVWSARYVGEVKRKWVTSVPPWVHFKNVCYQVRAAEQNGFKAAILLTGHYGPNWKDLKTLSDLIQPHVRVRLYALPDWEANTPGFDLDGRSGGDHAGKVETSLLWALDPECVDLSRIPADAREVPADGRRYESDRKTGSPREGDAAFTTPPYFAMGANAPESDRRVGERMVADEVIWIGEKVAELLEQYADGPAGFTTFESVERFWEREVRPAIAGFESMQRVFDAGGDVPEGSVWYDNWDVPARS